MFLELYPDSNFAKASNPYTWSFEGGPHHGKSYRVFAYILTLGRNVEQDETSKLNMRKSNRKGSLFFQFPIYQNGPYK